MPPPDDTLVKQKVSINLTDEAASVVKQLATEQGTTSSEVIRRGIALEKFVLDQLKEGGTFLIERDNGSVERVHFVFGF